MKFVALISGGKDSCYNAIKCVSYGHELVCMGNLCPPVDFVGEELNSFMYQSAAYGLIPSQQKCFDIPMVRRPIFRTSVDQSLGFDLGNEDPSVASSDEVEDLYLLLRDVKAQFPSVSGVSCGAIVSTYQRLRLEFVCGKLGLTPLCFLWQKDRNELLNEIIDVGHVDAILVKVAGAGLLPAKHLGKSLRDMRPALHIFHAKYGLDVCGEGGEYESLVLDCPLFKRKLSIALWDIVADEEGSDLSVGNLKALEYSVVEKAPAELTVIERRHPRRDLLQEAARFIDQHCSIIEPDVILDPSDSVKKAPVAITTVTVGEGEGCVSYRTPTLHVHRHSGLAQTSLLTPHTPYLPVAEQVRDCMQQLNSLLSEYEVEIADAVFVHLYISSISLFAIVNEEYCKWFGRHPPSRSCVAVPLPEGSDVALDAFVYRHSYRSIADPGKRYRKVLHVQSMSEWAPLCIGPYAQANVIEDALIYVAGQVPLDPVTMQVVQVDDCPEEFPVDSEGDQSSSNTKTLKLLYCQLWLACRHAIRVLSAVDARVSTVLCCTLYVNLSLLRPRGREEGPVCVDAPLIKSLKKIVTAMIAQYSTPVVDANEGEDASEAWDDNDGSALAHIGCPISVVGVTGIPRDALVEVELVALKGSFIAEQVVRVGSWTSADADFSQHRRSADSTSFVREVLSWPMWSSKGLSSTDTTRNSTATMTPTTPTTTTTTTTTIAQQGPVPVPPPVAAAVVVGVSCSTVSSRIHRCLSAGFMYLDISQSTSTSSIELQIALFMSKELDMVQLLPEDILSIRAYSSRRLDMDFGSKLGLCLGLHTPLSVIALESPSLSVSSIIVQFIIVDLPQLTTEAWIRNG